jgi:carbonic anhydrase
VYYSDSNREVIVQKILYSLAQPNSMFLALALVSIIGCSPGSSETPMTDTSSEEPREEHHEIHWGYKGEEGPDHWAGLSEEFALCASGEEQSPIDLTSVAPIDGMPLGRLLGETVLTDDQRETVLEIIDNGHTIQVTPNLQLSIVVDDEVYELVQYHFHAPSEHMIDGEHAPLEVHFVHKSAAGELAVLGALVEEGEYDPRREALLSALPDGAGDKSRIEDLYITIDEFWPMPTRFYRYEGSLTTPPCSEGVQWVVMADKLQLSADQIAELASHLHDNNRPVQPLNERTLTLVSAEDAED